MKYLYGPVPSRRLGISLGISPIPKKYCNYSCIYCQLGRTDHMTNTRQMFFPVGEILAELDEWLRDPQPFDVVTIVGEGEPTLYLGLGELISGIRERVSQPIAVITNGALLFDAKLRQELAQADIVLPTMDAVDEATFQSINRPHGALDHGAVVDGLVRFANEFKGQLWLELMLIQGINDDEATLLKYRQFLDTIPCHRLYLNTPVRPPAEAYVHPIDKAAMTRAVEFLGGISLDFLVPEGFSSEIPDDRNAILSIIRRHPMNQFEIDGFLKARGVTDTEAILESLRESDEVQVIHYKGYDTFRLS